MSYDRCMPVVRVLPLLCAAFAVGSVLACLDASPGGGRGDDFVPCADGVDAGVDAGFCDPTELATDGPDGGGQLEQDDIACAALRVSACGENDECLRDPGCVAADLVARFEPERCAEAAGDARSFPPCELGNCTVLTDRVCGLGEAGACEDAPACAPARELARRADGGDVSADASCAQALADEALFPSCG